MEMHRQGDILFVRVNENEIPEDAREQKDGVVAKGEVTGHHHRIKPGAVATLLVAANMAAWIRAKGDTDIVHEEHDTITLPPGDWEVRRQREYEPAGWRQVAD